LAKEAGIKVGRAIITDEYMQTSHKDVYAAGDCVESYDCVSGQCKILALWPNASNQGETAGHNMSTQNKHKAPNAFAMNAISFFGLQLISAGLIGEADQNSVFDVGANKLRRLNIEDDKLIGFVLINDVQRAGIYTALINDKTPLSSLEYDIKSKDIGLSIYPKDARTCKIWSGK
jgi:NAD(P)H-nitrite reductase large subunit